MERLHERGLLQQESIFIDLIAGNPLCDLGGHQAFVLEKPDKKKAHGCGVAKVLIYRDPIRLRTEDLIKWPRTNMVNELIDSGFDKVARRPKQSALIEDMIKRDIPLFRWGSKDELERSLSPMRKVRAGYLKPHRTARLAAH
jgi:hypothetical protein